MVALVLKTAIVDSLLIFSKKSTTELWHVAYLVVINRITLAIISNLRYSFKALLFAVPVSVSANVSIFKQKIVTSLMRLSQIGHAVFTK